MAFYIYLYASLDNNGKTMMDVSLVASACRPKLWGELLLSLEGNKCEYEVILVGPIPPHIKDGENPHLKWIDSRAWPAECYQIGFNHAVGTLVHWTADDCIYSKGCLDIILDKWKFYSTSWPFKAGKVILEPLLYENYGNGWHENSRTQKFDSRRLSPLMAPFGFMSREWFNKLGGYDRNFICGQAESDICLRAMQDGGRVRIVKEAEAWVDHYGKHGGVEGTDFSKGYLAGRKFLESCWIKDGKLSKKRLKPLEPFI